jgi:hypothetical protein
MADELLKKVRVTDDVILEIYKQGSKRKYSVIIDGSTQIKSDKYDISMGDDAIINETLYNYSMSKKNMTEYYKVVQDPYKDTFTKRFYGDGKSPYYLNNGCKIFIEWTGYIPNPKFVLGTFSTAQEAKIGTKNDPDRFLSNQPITSNEDNSKLYDMPPFSTWVVPTGEVNASLQPVPNYRDSSSVTSKKITIHLPDGFTENGGKGYLILTKKNDDLGYSTDGNENDTKYSSTKDANIISVIISKFKTMVTQLHGIADYDLKLCDPDTEACKIIEYKSPLEAPNKTTDQAAVADTPPVSTNPVSKIKFNIEGLPEVIEVKAKEDLPTFTVWAGPIPKLVDEQVDSFYDLSELDAEYKEGLYAGKEEEIVQLNAIDDVPAGPAFDEQLAAENGPVDKSEIGKGPILGSKLTNKAGTSMINLAGHRLTPILKDLENYLNKNGYPGTKIGNNGVMRNLRDSAYPSSPARASASLHGAGLAIDVIFKIPGFKWAGIGDNGNLSKDPNLTRVIANFVKGQGDITWGASWGKGSKPAEGLVYARGITEYHHFEIRSDLIPSYWEPVKDELAKFGFKPSDLKSPGKGGNLHKLMLKLLGDA